MSALTTLETDLDCGEWKEEEDYSSVFVVFRERERERERAAAAQISAVATKCYILLLFIFFCLGCSSFPFSLSQVSLCLSRKERRRRRDRHTQKKERGDGSAFFPLEKYLPLVSRKIKDKNKIWDASGVCAFLAKKTNHHPLSLAIDFLRAKDIYSAIKSTLAIDRSIEGWEDRAEKLPERRKLCSLIFDFRSKRASEARSERAKVFGFGKKQERRETKCWGELNKEIP